MIDVVRNHEWLSILKDITNRDKIREIKHLGFYFKLTDSIWRANKHYELLKLEKIQKRIKIISKEKSKENTQPTNNICGAKNLNGTPCKFKACGGKFCKKHSSKN